MSHQQISTHDVTASTSSISQPNGATSMTTQAAENNNVINNSASLSSKNKDNAVNTSLFDSTSIDMSKIESLRDCLQKKHTNGTIEICHSEHENPIMNTGHKESITFVLIDSEGDEQIICPFCGEKCDYDTRIEIDIDNNIVESHYFEVSWLADLSCSSCSHPIKASENYEILTSDEALLKTLLENDDTDLYPDAPEFADVNLEINIITSDKKLELNITSDSYEEGRHEVQMLEHEINLYELPDLWLDQVDELIEKLSSSR